MNGITTITTKGQVTIPEEIRRMLQIKIGDKVSFLNVKTVSKEAMIKIIPSNIVDKLFGSLVTKVKISDHKKARLQAGKMLVGKYKTK